MSLNEFEIIARYFQKLTFRDDVKIGVGDDCAVVRPRATQDIAISSDTLNCGVHFHSDIHPFDLGYKALAVSLSDLAAMGAEPAWFLLNLTLPEAEFEWLEKFASGLFSLSERFGLQLIGGDTTRGPLSVTITALGYVDKKAALERKGAQVGDDIYVTGTLGDAGLALKILQKEIKVSEKEKAYLYQRLVAPEPRVEIGLLLRNIASAAIDISDGLILDLGHLLVQSDVGASIQTDAIPLSSAFSDIPAQTALELAMTSGDDYELCFTANPKFQKQIAAFNVPQGIHRIGKIEQQQGLRICDKNGDLVILNKSGYIHFE